MDIKNILERNKRWVEEKLGEDVDFFKKLGEGQNPNILYIGCSDSRVTAEELMGVGPGEIFVHRNIANMVISIDLNAMSVIEYAVNYLNVDHIIVCGHYGCGGIKAAMESKDLGVLNPWLRNIRDVYRLHRRELNEIENEDARYERLVELNVQEQCINAIKTAAVQKANRSRGLKVYGWVFDVHTGQLKDLNIDFDLVLKNIREIYHLD
ncbi:carbonic anhydrase [Bacteriovorax sp. Seq25_V]|uniref:carbonic anhydrase n=1 Tax=Bacteriovorax sp. Seq25_V TaxID=1201288 RepID=UPI00038A2573|nr:carbonic anhydrase [Bacteriovorax sp. Seq25_V]EQC47446.1 putative Carbonic anhydrase 2 [Bacteriovorax sp. Seq25_V]